MAQGREKIIFFALQCNKNVWPEMVYRSSQLKRRSFTCYRKYNRKVLLLFSNAFPILDCWNLKLLKFYRGLVVRF